MPFKIREDGAVKTVADVTVPQGNVVRGRVRVDGELRTFLDDTATTYSSWSFSEVLIDSISDADASAIADIDGDGDMDVVIGNGGNGGIYWYENNGDGTWTQHTIQPDATYDEVEGTDVADIDGDGKFEVLVLDQNGVVAICKQDSSDPTGSWSSTTLDSSAPWVNSGYFEDIDEDGVDDILYGYQGDSDGTGGVYWLQYTGGGVLTASNWTKHTISQTNNVRPVAHERKDWSENGEATDIAFGAGDGTSRNPAPEPGLYIAEKPSDPTNTWNVTQYDSKHNGGKVRPADLSGDGERKDLAVIGYQDDTHKVLFYEWDGSSFSKTEYISGVNYHNIHPLDLTNETGDDLFMANATDDIAELYSRNSDGTYTQEDTLGTYSKIDSEINVHDLDADGFPDVITTDAGGKALWFDINGSE